MRPALPRRAPARRCLTALTCLLLAVAPARAQEEAPLPPPPNGISDDAPPVKDTSVGYIDSALPFTHLRLRYDSAYRNVRPTRAEFFYAQGQPGGPGLPRPETSVDYQEPSAYLEVAFEDCFSVFAEAPFRFLNPQINDNSGGYGDTLAGAKFVFAQGCDWFATAQVKGYFPTGDASRGLGTRHFSVEPGLLFQKCFDGCVRFEGELRYWIPIDGTDFAGSVLRYGIGVSVGRVCEDGFWVTPVAEFVGWTVLDGKQAVVASPTDVRVIDADGDTIINGKFGVRVGLRQCLDVYAGYGHAFTGDTWYRDIYRVEMRLRF